MSPPVYEIYAIRYATRSGQRRNQFLGGDPHDAPMPLDYFVWLVRNDERTIVVDTGFTADVAKRRQRDYLRTPASGLALLGVNPSDVRDVIITHLHYDHAGTAVDFANARLHLQEEEMAYATGRSMCYPHLSHPYSVDDVVQMVRRVYEGHVSFHAGTADIAPGVSVHHIGGHTAGLQSVRVHTRRGWMVLASDAAHFYEHMETGRCFPNVLHVGQMLEGYDKLRRLADSPAHIIPGHDPLVMRRYSAPTTDLEGIAVRLDVPPAR